MSGQPRMVKAFAPATVANVASGFDVLGFAVSHPGDTVEASRTEAGGVTLREVTGDGGRLPRDGRNTAVIAVRALLERLGEPFGVELALHKGMPMASGLGGSAASAAAALVAVNRLAGDAVPPEELLPCALAAERAAAGAGHADNAAPALMGGVVLIRSGDPPDLVRLPVPAGLAVALLSPDVEIRTAAARRMLPTEIPLTRAVSQWGNLAALVASLHSGDLALMGRSMHDVVAEPVRAALIPGFDRVKEAALAAGAIGCSISGSGPAVFALAATAARAAEVGECMKEAFATAGLRSVCYVSEIGTSGPCVLAES
ncbi:MAG: homoserine kinase [Spirochaetaceae bacterium]|nr:homoserine kinase [Spirochaetaceae bacterium]